MELYLPGLLRRTVIETDFSDLTASVVESAYWCPDRLDVLVVAFDVEPSEAEQTAIRRRLVTTDAADEQRLADLLAQSTTGLLPILRLWLDDQLAAYGEPYAGVPEGTEIVGDLGAMVT